MRPQNKQAFTLGVFAFYCLFTYAWISWVDPFPDRDGLNQIFYPHLSYLELSKIIGNEFWALSCVGSPQYPSGFFLLSALIASFGLQDLFFQNPWLVHIFLLLGLTAIAVLFPVPKQSRIYFAFIIFFLPSTQLLLKGYNPHAYNVVFSVLGIVLFYRYLLNRSFIYLIMSAFSFWFSCVVKHLGVINFLSFFCARLFIMISRDKIEWKELIIYFVLIICCLPFYDFSFLKLYIEETSKHNLDVDLLIRNILKICIASLIMFFAYLCLSKVRDYRLNFDWKALMFYMAFICFVVLQPIDIESSTLFIVTSLSGILLFFGGLLVFQLKAIKNTLSFTIIASFTISCMFYFSQLGQATPIFFFTLYIMLFLVFLKKHPKKYYRVAVILCILCSNFFSSFLFSEGEWEKITTRGFNITHFNPWSWERSYMNKMINNIANELETYDFGRKKKLFIIPNAGVHVSALFQFWANPYKQIETINLLENYNEELEPYMEAFTKGNMDKMTELSNSGIIAFIIVDKNQELFLSGKAEKLKTINKKITASNYFGGLTKQMIFSSFYHAKLLNRDYHLKNFSYKNLSYDLWVHNKYKKEKKETINGYLESLRMTSLIAINKQNEIAMDIIKKSGKFSDKKRMLEALLLAHEGFRLFPKHNEIAKDLELFKLNTSPLEKRLIDLYGFDLMKKVLLDIGYLPFENPKLKNKYPIDLVDNLIQDKSKLLNQDLIEIQRVSEKDGLLAMIQLIAYMYLHPRDSSALDLYLKLYKEKNEFEELRRKSNLATENYLFYKDQDREKAIWFLKKAIYIYPKNKKALDFARNEDFDSITLSLNLPKKYRKFYKE